MDIQTIIDKKEELLRAFMVVSQPRSDFQLKKFVVEEHETLERQYMQVVTELQRKVSSIRRASVEKNKKTRWLSIETDPDELEILQIDLDDLAFALNGAVSEFNTLYAIYQTMPDFTAQQLQDAEEKYWINRLARQAQIDIDSIGTISAGNIDALRQVGLMQNGGNRFLETLKAVPGIDSEILEKGKLPLDSFKCSD